MGCVNLNLPSHGTMLNSGPRCSKSQTVDENREAPSIHHVRPSSHSEAGCRCKTVRSGRPLIKCNAAVLQQFASTLRAGLHAVEPPSPCSTRKGTVSEMQRQLEGGSNRLKTPSTRVFPFMQQPTCQRVVPHHNKNVRTLRLCTVNMTLPHHLYAPAARSPTTRRALRVALARSASVARAVTPRLSSAQQRQ